MGSLTVEMRMGKRKGRPPSEHHDVTVRIDRTLAQQLRYVANWKGLSAARLLDQLLTGPLSREYAKISKDLQRDLGETE